MATEWVAALDPVNLPIERCPVPREAASRRILIFRTLAFGDLVMLSPLVRALRRAWPDCHISVAVEKGYREGIDAHPNVDAILLWDTFYFKKPARQGLFPVLWARQFALRQQLPPFDIFINLQPEDYGWLPGLVGAPQRIGVFDAFLHYHGKKKTSARRRFYTDVFTLSDLPDHRTDQFLLPLSSLGLQQPSDKSLSLGFTQDDEARATALLTKPGIALAPTTGWPSRNWPTARWIALGRELLQRHALHLHWLGTPADAALLEEISQEIGSPRQSVIAGANGFRTMAAVIAGSRLLISGDTGPMHVAAAVGTPYLALFGPTPANGRAPLNGRGVTLQHAVPCGPCDKKQCSNIGEEKLQCLKLITVEEVLGAVLDCL